MQPTDAEIEQAAREFRGAIDAAGSEPWQRKDMTFPRGACGHAAELLGHYLIERFGIGPEYVNAMAHENLGGWRHSHAWLEWNGLTIDITGDQFGWEPVIVTREPEFHGRGEDGQRHWIRREYCDGWFAINCGSLWKAIKPHLPKLGNPN